MVIGADTTPSQLLTGAHVLRGHPAGTAQDVEEAMAFSVLHGIRPLIETVPLDQADAPFQKMQAGKARFRMLLTPGG